MPDWVREARRYRAWLDVAGELAFGRTRLQADEIIGVRLLETFEAVGSTHNVVDDRWRIRHSAHWALIPLPATQELARTPDPSWQPLLRWYATRTEREPHTIDGLPRSVITPRFRAVWDEFARPLQIEQQLSIPLQMPGAPLAGFVIARPGDDFTDQDRDLARLLQPLLTAALRQHDVLCTSPSVADNAGLTNRELAVLSLLSTGRTAAAIARQLAIAPRTVHKHLQNIYRKLGASDRVTALLQAERRGLHLGPGIPARQDSA